MRALLAAFVIAGALLWIFGVRRRATEDVPEDLRPDERELESECAASGRPVPGDRTQARIRWLIARRLERLATDESGWDLLYRDPLDGRLWECTFPASQLQGGGPMRLALISPADARSRYGAPAERATLAEDAEPG